MEIQMKGLIIYSSKYGSTREYAEFIAGELGSGKWKVESGKEVTLEAAFRTVPAGEVDKKDIMDADLLALGSPIYAYSVLPDMEKLLKEQSELIASKPCAAFVVCGDTLWNPKAGEGGDKNLRKLTDKMGSEPFAVAVLGGRMRMDELDEVDGPRILAFYERLGRSPDGYDRMSLSAASEFCEEIKLKLGRE
jgi:menaquinone-dependent protoporphyrinogen IX oxidase